MSGGLAVIVVMLWYLEGQFASIAVQLTQVVSKAIQSIKHDLDSHY